MYKQARNAAEVHTCRSSQAVRAHTLLSLSLPVSATHNCCCNSYGEGPRGWLIAWCSYAANGRGTQHHTPETMQRHRPETSVHHPQGCHCKRRCVSSPLEVGHKGKRWRLSLLHSICPSPPFSSQCQILRPPVRPPRLTSIPAALQRWKTPAHTWDTRTGGVRGNGAPGRL